MLVYQHDVTVGLPSHAKRCSSFSLNAPGIFCKVAGKRLWRHENVESKLGTKWKLTFGIIFS